MSAVRPQSLRLTVEIFGAKGLRNADGAKSGVSDPYCSCEVSGKPATRVMTPVIMNDLNPVWNYKAQIELADNEMLCFQVFDQDIGQDDEFLGSVEVLPADLCRATGVFEASLPLEDNSIPGGLRGRSSLHFRIQDAVKKPKRSTQKRTAHEWTPWKDRISRHKDAVIFVTTCLVPGQSAKPLEPVGTRCLLSASADGTVRVFELGAQPQSRIKLQLQAPQDGNKKGQSGWETCCPGPRRHHSFCVPG